MPLRTAAMTLLLALFAAGCATSPPAVPTQAVPPTDAAAPTVEILGSAVEEAVPGGELNLAEEASPFVYSVTAFEDVDTFPGPGFYNCIEGMEVLSSGTAGDNEMTFTLPPEIVAGEYVLQETTIETRLNYNGVTFETGVLGLLTLEEAPNAQGDRVVGSFDFFVNNGEGLTVNASGSFSLLANGVCP